MANLNLVKSEKFGDVKCDFYNDGKDIWLTRKQVGEALEYGNPNDAIKDIHNRHKERLDKFSTQRKLRVVEGSREVSREMILYSAKGIYEICRWSQQPKADAFFDWVYEILEGLRKGELKIDKTEIKVADLKQKEIEARLKNSRTRAANLYLKIADRTNIQEYKQIMNALAVQELSGQAILPLPTVERRTYSAKELGEILGISSVMVGRIANQQKLKIEEFGKWFYDKSPHSCKEVETWRYYDTVIPKFREILNVALDA